jgi:hypothetical protein
MTLAIAINSMTKTELLELKADVNHALEQKKYVSGLDIGTEFASRIKGKKPVITKQLFEQMMDEAAK